MPAKPAFAQQGAEPRLRSADGKHSRQTRSHNNVTNELLGQLLQSASPSPLDPDSGAAAGFDSPGGNDPLPPYITMSRQRRTSNANSIGSISLGSINTYFDVAEMAKDLGFQNPTGSPMNNFLYQSPLSGSSQSTAAPSPMSFGRTQLSDAGSPMAFRMEPLQTVPSPEYPNAQNPVRRSTVSVSPPRPPGSNVGDAMDPSARLHSAQAEMTRFVEQLKDENARLRHQLQAAEQRERDLLAQFNRLSLQRDPMHHSPIAPTAQPESKPPQQGILVRYEEDGGITPLGLVDLPQQSASAGQVGLGSVMAPVPTSPVLQAFAWASKSEGNPTSRTPPVTQPSPSGSMYRDRGASAQQQQQQQQHLHPHSQQQQHQQQLQATSNNQTIPLPIFLTQAPSTSSQLIASPISIRPQDLSQPW